MNSDLCIYCSAPLEMSWKTPEGREKLINQEYLKCPRCGQFQCRMCGGIGNE